MIRYSTPERRSFASTTAGRVEYTAKDNAYSYVEAGQSVSGAIKGFAVDLCGLQKKVLSGDLSCCTAQPGVGGSYFAPPVYIQTVSNLGYIFAMDKEFRCKIVK